MSILDHAVPTSTRDAVTTLHHHFSSNLAAAMRVDPDAPEAEELVLRAMGEARVREHVACTLLAALAHEKFEQAVNHLYRRAWCELDSGISCGFEAEAWHLVANWTAAALDDGLDAELAELLTDAGI